MYGQTVLKFEIAPKSVSLAGGRFQIIGWLTSVGLGHIPLLVSLFLQY